MAQESQNNRAAPRPSNGAPARRGGARRSAFAGALVAVAAALLCAASFLPAAAAAGCSKGDLPCFCRQAGGWWETPPSPLLRTCKFKWSHQGRER